MSTAAQPAPLKGETTVIEPTRAERTAARRNAEVRATIPDLECAAELDAAPLLAAASERSHGATAHLAAACAAALRAHPRVNAAYRDGRFELYGRVNVAVAVPAVDGWLAPVLHDADRRSAAELADELQRLAAAAAGGELTPPELAGATFTLTDLGAYPVSRAGALIVPGQAAGLVAAAAQAVPVVHDGAVVPGHRVTLTLAADARILGAADAAAFLGAVAGAVG